MSETIRTPENIIHELPSINSDSKVQNQFPFLGQRVGAPSNKDIPRIMSNDYRTISKLISSNHVNSYRNLNKIDSKVIYISSYTTKSISSTSLNIVYLNLPMDL